MSIQAADSASVDAFGRWRVSSPFVLFDSKQTHDSGPFFWDDAEETGTGTTSTFVRERAGTILAVASATAGKRTRQTYQRFNYQPGQSQKIQATFVLDSSGGGTGIVRSVGYFDDQNGLFIRDNEGTVELVRRTFVTSAVVDNAVSQTNWNIDPMDGSGPSGVTLDWTKVQLMLIDFQWLGGGRVRWGFSIAGRVIYVHEEFSGNVLDSVFMSEPSLPMRYQIENDGTGVASGLEHLSCTVVSEGGAKVRGVLRNVNAGPMTLTTIDTRYIILSGRLLTTHKAVAIDLISMSMLLSTNNDSGRWEFVVGGTVTGSLSYVAQTNGAVEVAAGNGTQTLADGVTVDAGYLVTEDIKQFIVTTEARMGTFIDGTPQTWYLVFTPYTANVELRATVTRKESG
jgi:hypothetical protein